MAFAGLHHLKSKQAFVLPITTIHMEFENTSFNSLFALGLMPRFCKCPMESTQSFVVREVWVTRIRICLVGHNAFMTKGSGSTSAESRESTAGKALRRVKKMGNVFVTYCVDSKQWLARKGQLPYIGLPKRLWPEEFSTRTHVATRRLSGNHRCRLPQGHDGFCADVYSGVVCSPSDFWSGSDSDSESQSEETKDGFCSRR